MRRHRRSKRAPARPNAPRRAEHRRGHEKGPGKTPGPANADHVSGPARTTSSPTPVVPCRRAPPRRVARVGESRRRAPVSDTSEHPGTAEPPAHGHIRRRRLEQPVPLPQPSRHAHRRTPTRHAQPDIRLSSAAPCARRRFHEGRAHVRTRPRRRRAGPRADFPGGALPTGSRLRAHRVNRRRSCTTGRTTGRTRKPPFGGLREEKSGGFLLSRDASVRVPSA